MGVTEPQRLRCFHGTRRIKWTPDIVETMLETSPIFKAKAASSKACSRWPRWKRP